MKISASAELTEALTTGKNLHLAVSFSDLDTDAAAQATEFLVDTLTAVAYNLPPTNVRKDSPDAKPE